jgi:hypothetical protein
MPTQSADRSAASATNPVFGRKWDQMQVGRFSESPDL